MNRRFKRRFGSFAAAGKGTRSAERNVSIIWPLGVGQNISAQEKYTPRRGSLRGVTLFRCLSVDQRQFFRALQALDRGLAPQRGAFVGKLLPVYHAQRAAPARVLGAGAALMCAQALFNVRGNAGVERAIPAAEDIDPVAYTAQ